MTEYIMFDYQSEFHCSKTQKTWLSQFEDEELWIYSEEGKRLHYAKGDPSGVVFPTELDGGYPFSKARARHTHTTTIAGTFSKDDIETTVNLNLARHDIEATLENRTYSLERTPSSTPEKREDFKVDFIKKEDETFEMLKIDYWEKNLKAKGLPLAYSDYREADRVLKIKMDEWLTENAGRFGYKYRS